MKLRSSRHFTLYILLCCFCGSVSGQSPARPLAAYLQEGFNAAGIPSGWTVTQVSGTTAAWSVVGVGTNPPIAPYAGTGQAKFNSYDAVPGHQSRLTSRRTNMSGSTDPFLSFFMYHEDEFFSSLDSVYVEATTGDSVAGPWTTLAGYRRPRINPGWSQDLVSLLQYNGASRLFISFRGVSQYGNNIYMDEVRVADSSFHDIGTVALFSSGSSFDIRQHSALNTSTFSRLETNSTNDSTLQRVTVFVPSYTSPVNIGTIVQNVGTFSEPSYQVQWRVDGQSQTPVNSARTLARNSRAGLCGQPVEYLSSAERLSRSSWTLDGLAQGGTPQTACLVTAPGNVAVGATKGGTERKRACRP